MRMLIASSLITIISLCLVDNTEGVCNFVNYVANCQHVLGGKHNVEARLTINRCRSPVSLDFILQGHINSTKLVWKHTFINAKEDYTVAGFGEDVRIQVALTRYADSNKLYVQTKFFVNDVQEESFGPFFINLSNDGCVESKGPSDSGDTGLVVLVVVLSVTALLATLAGVYMWYMHKHGKAKKDNIRDKRGLMTSVESSLNATKKTGNTTGCAGACGGSDSSTGYDNSLTMSSKSGSQDQKSGVITIPSGHLAPVSEIHVDGPPYGGVYTGENPNEFGPAVHREHLYAAAKAMSGQHLQVEVELNDIYRNQMPDRRPHSTYNDSLRLAQVSSDSDGSTKGKPAHKRSNGSGLDLRRSAIERNMHIQKQPAQSPVQNNENLYKEYWIDNVGGNSRGLQNPAFRGDGENRPMNNNPYGELPARANMSHKQLSPTGQNVDTRDHSLSNRNQVYSEERSTAYPHSHAYDTYHMDELPPQVPPKTSAARQTPEGSSNQDIKNSYNSREDIRHPPDYRNNSELHNARKNNDYSHPRTFNTSSSFYATEGVRKDNIRNGHIPTANGHMPEYEYAVRNGYLPDGGVELSASHGKLYLTDEQHEDSVQSSMV